VSAKKLNNIYFIILISENLVKKKLKWWYD